jgi:hypothetical protein
MPKTPAVHRTYRTSFFSRAEGQSHDKALVTPTWRQGPAAFVSLEGLSVAKKQTVKMDENGLENTDKHSIQKNSSMFFPFFPSFLIGKVSAIALSIINVSASLL